MGYSTIYKTYMAYIDTNHTYTDPSAYDARSKKLLERWNKAAWEPVILATGKQVITTEDIVCDFGCGTLAHIQAMLAAKHIYAIDVNKQMLETGLKKLSDDTKSKITPVISDARHTPIPNATCSVVWSIGLTEYTNLDELFKEMTRASSPHARMLLQFPNKYHPMHIAIKIVNSLRGKKTKQFRSFAEIKKVARRYGWNIKNVRTAFIRNNLWCVLQKSTLE